MGRGSVRPTKVEALLLEEGETRLHLFDAAEGLVVGGLARSLSILIDLLGDVPTVSEAELPSGLVVVDARQSRSGNNVRHRTLVNNKRKKPTV